MKFPDKLKIGLSFLNDKVSLNLNSFGNGYVNVDKNTYVFINIQALKEAVELFDGFNEQTLLDSCIEARINYVPSSVRFSEDVYLKGLKIKNNNFLEFNEEILVYNQTTYFINSLKTNFDEMPVDVQTVFKSLKTLKIVEESGEIKLHIKYSSRCLDILRDFQLELDSEILEKNVNIRYFNGEIHNGIEIWNDFEGKLINFVESIRWTQCVVHGINGILSSR